MFIRYWTNRTGSCQEKIVFHLTKISLLNIIDADRINNEHTIEIVKVILLLYVVVDVLHILYHQSVTKVWQN